MLVYGPLRNVLGMSRIRVAYTAGAAIGPDLFRFYRSIGVNLKQLYGSTETCAYVCLQPDGQIKLDSVGLPAPGRGGEDRRQRRGAGAEPRHAARSTTSARTRPPRCSTSKATSAPATPASSTPDGHLKIIDRAKDVGRLANGAMFAPNYIENKLKFFPYIKEAVAFGHDREMVCAFINIDLGAVGNWAERRGLAYSGYTDLAGKPEVYDLIQECVEKVNADLAADPMVADSQVHALPDAAQGARPRRRRADPHAQGAARIRRREIRRCWSRRCTAAGASCHIETEVKFEDGRRGHDQRRRDRSGMRRCSRTPAQRGSAA